MATRTAQRDWWILGAALAAVVVVVVLIVIKSVGGDDSSSVARGKTGQSASGQKPAAASLGPLGELAHRTAGDPLARGRTDAPVALVEYSDFRCPFCGQFSRDTEPKLVDKYVKSGKLRIEWRDMPIFGDQSVAAARAGRAAAAQAKFWEFQKVVYAHAPAAGHPDLPPDILRKYAREAGVPDMARFDADASGTAFDAAIKKDFDETQMFGFSATPAFSINGTPMLGARPLSTFESLIDAAGGR